MSSDTKIYKIKTFPVFFKPKKIIGNNLIFKNATIEDAAFILELRTDSKKSKYISKTPNDLEHQIKWLEKYEIDNEQIYFIILNKNYEKVGTIRLYEKNRFSFWWGSWILKDGVPSIFAIESVLIIYHFALSLGFKKAIFNIRKDNRSVWKFHEIFGAIKTSQTNDDFIYSISHESIKKSLVRYKKYLTNKIRIED
jgi:hypothetical protein